MRRRRPPIGTAALALVIAGVSLSPARAKLPDPLDDLEKDAQKVRKALSPDRLAHKIVVDAKEFAKLFTVEDGKTVYHYGPGDSQKAVLMTGGPYGTTSSGGTTTSSTTSSSKTSTSTSTTSLPSAVTAYASYYNGVSGATATPAQVTHKDRQSIISDQGPQRGTCSAFAAAAALEALYGKKKLSVEYLWWLYNGKNDKEVCKSANTGAYLSQVSAALRESGVPEDFYWTYLPLIHYPGLCPVGPTGLAKDMAKKTRPRSVIDLSTGSSSSGAWLNNPLFLEAILAAGYDIVVGVGVAWKPFQNSWLIAYKGVLDVVKDSSGKAKASSGGHAMVIVGYERTNDGDSGGGYFILKNSWGIAVGETGYIKLSYDYLRQYADEAFFITGL